MWGPAALARRALLLGGWAALVLFVWWSVPYAVAFAVDPIVEAAPAGAGSAPPLGIAPEILGERLRALLRVLLLLWACAAAAALSWIFLLTAGGIRGTASLFATLIAALYLLGTPYATALGVEPDAPLGGVRQAAHTLVSLAVSWLFAVALGAILLRAEPRTATARDQAAPEERSSVTRVDEDLVALVEQRLRALADEADDDAYARTLVAICADALGADRCSVFFVCAADREIRSRSGTGLKADIRVPLGMGLVGHVVRTAAPLLVTDAHSDPRFDASADARTGYRTASVLAVPLLRREAVPLLRRGKVVFGVLQALNRRDGTFGPADRALLTRITRLARPRLERMYVREVLRRRPGRPRV